MAKKPLILRIVCILGLLLMLNGLAVLFMFNFNFGPVFLFILGLGLFLLGWFYDLTKRGFGLALKLIFFCGLAFVIGMSGFLTICGQLDTVDYTEDALIVLGAGLRGDQISMPLAYRLDQAVRYAEANPDAVIVVSGGQGPQETISEAVAMTQYLIAQGVPAGRIIQEGQATDTYENFVCSKDILDEHFGRSYKIAYVTNTFHVFRAHEIACIAGFENPSHIHSKLGWYSWITSNLRECAAVIKLWILKR